MIDKILDWCEKNYLKTIAIVLSVMALLVLCVLWSVANAADAPLTWTQPTQYEDGSVLPANAITGYDISYGACAADKKSITAPATTISVPPAPLAKTITGLGNGTWCFQLRTVTAGGSSIWTVDSITGLLAWKQIILLPKPPGTVTVGGGTGIAYMAVRQNDRYVMIPVGTVPGGTVCDSGNAVVVEGAAYYVVPTSVVNWYGSTHPSVALATCS